MKQSVKKKRRIISEEQLLQKKDEEEKKRLSILADAGEELQNTSLSTINWTVKNEAMTAVC